MKYTICALTAIFVISCAHTPEPRQSSQRLNTSGTLIETIPIAPPDVPQSLDGSCIDYSLADEFGLAQADYYRETKEQAALARGWTFLDPAEFSEKNTHDHDFQYALSGGTLEDLGSGRYRDESGQIWLAVGETGACTQSFGEFVIDKELNVFEVAVSRSCREDVELLQCGTMAMGGCGMAPNPEDRQVWFVKAPETATFSAQPQTLYYSVERCVQIRAEEGLSVPPASR